MSVITYLTDIEFAAGAVAARGAPLVRRAKTRPMLV